MYWKLKIRMLILCCSCCCYEKLDGLFQILFKSKLYLFLSVNKFLFLHLYFNTFAGTMKMTTNKFEKK